MHYNGHEQEVRLLLPLGDQLISADSGGDVIVWDVQSGGESEVVWLALHSPAVAYMCSYPSCLTLSASQRCTCGCTLTHQPLTYRPWCTRAPTWTRCSWGAPRVHCSSGTSRPGEGVALDSEHWQKHTFRNPPRFCLILGFLPCLCDGHCVKRAYKHQWHNYHQHVQRSLDCLSLWALVSYKSIFCCSMLSKINYFKILNVFYSFIKSDTRTCVLNKYLNCWC